MPVQLRSFSITSIASSVEPSSDSAEFNAHEVKVELVWCPLMSTIRLFSESHLFRYFADALAVARNCFIISFLGAITDANLSLFGYSIFRSGMMESQAAANSQST
jgi:hypothetical protein